MFFIFNYCIRWYVVLSLIAVSIKTVEVKGFKTFAGTIKLRLSDRLTGVVGPNGSGKSNLVDAIRWGIGEKTHNLLRISSPADVIFAGIGKRRPLSLAEVSITLDNSKHTYPNENESVDVTRRIYRSGETEFEINGSSCRLKDIGNLFRGTGLGKQTYSVVGQGEVDLVLSATPGERLSTMEELAGVDILRQTKRTVERKLNLAGVEMGRINATVAELNSNYERLRVQSEVLSKYKSISDRASFLKLQLLMVESREIEQELGSLGSSLQVIRRKERDSGEELEALEKDLSIKSRIKQLNEQRDKSREDREAMLVTKTRMQSQLEHKRERSAVVTEDIQKNVLKWEQDKKESERLIGSINQLEEQIEAQQTKVKLVKTEYERINSENNYESEDESQRAKLVHALDQQKTKADSIRKELSNTESGLTIIRERIRSNRERIVELEKCNDQSDDDADEKGLSEQLKKLSDKIEELEKNGSQLKAQKDLFVSELVGFKAERRSIAKSKEAKRKLLDGLIFLPSKLGKPILAETLDLSDMTPSDRKLLVDQLDWIVADDDAVDVTEHIPENSSATVVVGIPTCDVVENVSEALSSDNSVQLTRDGYLIIEGRYIFQSKGRVSEARVKGEIDDLEGEYKESESQIADVSDSIEKIDDQIAQLKLEIMQISKQKSSLQAEIANTVAERKEREKQQKTREDQLVKLKAELDNLVDDEEKKRTGLTQIQLDLSQTVSEIRSTGRELSDYDDKRFEREKRRAEVEKRIAEARRDVDQSQTLLRELTETLKRTQAEYEGLEKSIEETKGLIDNLEFESKQLADEIIETERQLNTANMAIVRAERLEKEFAEESSDLATKETEREEQVRIIRNRLNRYSKESHKIELSRVELTTKKDRLATDISELGGDPEGYIEEIDTDEMRAELADKTRQLAEYGAVNMKATEEAESARERLSFMEGQLSDLAQAEANLRVSLSEIETKIKDNFERVYRSVEREFTRLANILFPGAIGNLRRVKDEDGGIIGVQVEFILPGRRLKALQALSGGEKTLGALALLFAFFRTKSSPFCVLDEVDAALDDNNVERFTKLLRTEAVDTQFVIITHNKETMRWCDTLYGITLDASGTSTVVGVRLDEIEKSKQTKTS